MLEAAPGTASWLGRQAEQHRLYLYIETDRPRGNLETRLRLNGPGPKMAKPFFAGVAPWQLESVERVARVLRWYLWSAELLAYPPEVLAPSPDWTAPPSPPSWLSVGHGKVVVQKPANHEAWDALSARYQKQSDKRVSLEQKLKRVPKQNRGDRSHLLKQIDDLKAQIKADEDVTTQLEQAKQHLASLLKCPVCHTGNSSYEFEHTEKHFRVTCSTCGTGWGIRDCNSCQETFPYLSLSETAGNTEPLQADIVYGCDVLALPAGGGGFYCPGCGQHTDGEGTG
jgi:hypothetical protein